MTRFLLLALLLSLVFVVKLFEWNPGSVNFQYLPGHVIQLPEVALFVLSLGLGAGFVMVVHGTGDFLRWLRNLDDTREEKREEKVTALWKKVREELNRSHVPQALSLLERLVSLYPNHLEALLLLGNLRRSTGDATGAIRLHRRARVFDEEDVRLVLALCEDYRQAGRPDDEMALLGEYFHKKEGRNLDVLGRYRDRLVSRQKWEEALAVQSVLSRSLGKGERRDLEVATLVGIRYETGRLHLDQGETELARRSFRGALKIDPLFSPARIGLAEAQSREGRVSEAFTTLEEGYQKDRDPVYLYRLEEMVLEAGSPERILTAFERAVLADPQNPALLYAQARLYDRLMMVDLAQDRLESLEGRENWEGEFYRLLGDLYLRNKDRASALEAFQKGAHAENHSGRLYCRHCAQRLVRWTGQCPSCRRWGSVSLHPGYVQTPSLQDQSADDRKDSGGSLSDPTIDAYSLGQSG
ncbi:MAG: tetratricopeptide repeat protein [Nitrospirae bacterium]|jgi:lipopolysaccharide biosynthesis regulator YciM|nr:tetratricopeptide repeat protein [Nitrospirota bacterium]